MDCTCIWWSRLLLCPSLPTAKRACILFSNVKRVFPFNSPSIVTSSITIRIRPLPAASSLAVIWSLSRPTTAHLLFFLGPGARSGPVAFFLGWTGMVTSSLFRVWAALFPFSTSITISTFWLSFIGVASIRITTLVYFTTAMVVSEGVLALASARPRLPLWSGLVGGGGFRRCFG